MFIETIETISTGISFYEVSKTFFPTFQKIWHQIKIGNLKIIIFGAGGVGKSTLANLLSGKTNSNFKYEESIDVERYDFANHPTITLLVAPGQERREYTWDELLKEVTQGKISIVINVVSWGYHSFGEASYQDTEYYQQGMSKDEFLQAYLDNRRERELKALETLIPHLSIANKKTVMFTLVTKQDLWWDKRKDVQKYYEEGQYDQYINQIVEKRGQNNFIHEYLSASLIINNFLTAQNENLALTVAGYDQNFQNANLQLLLKNIYNCIKN